MSNSNIISTSPAPGQGAVAVTPSDTVSLTVAPCRGLWVGGAGNISALMEDGTSATFVGIAAGTLLPFSVRRVNASATTATSIVAVY